MQNHQVNKSKKSNGLNPFEKYACQNGSFPQGSGYTFTYLKPAPNIK